MAAAYRIQRLDLSRVFLDNINPRHDPIDNEPEIIGYLLSKELVKPLARDIAEKGTLSPLERLAVIPHHKVGGAFVSVEGNRRLCALKLLADPDKAPSEPEKRYFRQLAAKMRPKVDEVDAVLFANRKDARPWLSLRHEGALGGVGTRTWTANQKTRFDRGGRGGERTNNPNVQASMLLEYALNRRLITKPEHDGISLTTLTRYLKSPVFRHALGLTTPRDLQIIAPQDQFDRAVGRFLRDAFKNEADGVHSRTKIGQREGYAHRLQQEGMAATTRLQAAQHADAAAPGGPANPAAARKARSSRHPDKRRTVIPSDFGCAAKDKVFRRVFEEGRTLDATTYPFAAAYLLRAFIEQTVKLFCKDYGIGGSDVNVLAGKAADKLASDGIAERELKPLRRFANDKHGPLSPDTLGAYVHGGLIPNSTELARTWDTIEGNLRTLIERLK